MPSSLPSPSVTDHSHSQPPSPNLHDNQSSLLSSASAHPAVHESDEDEEEYTATLYLPVTQVTAHSHHGLDCNGKAQRTYDVLTTFSPFAAQRSHNLLSF
jgi:hypothetical protein